MAKCVREIPCGYEKLMDIVVEGPQAASEAALLFQMFPSEVERRVHQALEQKPQLLPKKSVDLDAPLVYRIRASDKDGGGSTVTLEVAYRPAPPNPNPTLGSTGGPTFGL